MDFVFYNKSNLKAYTLKVLLLWAFLFLVFYHGLDQPILQWMGTPDREKLRLMMRELTNIGLGVHYFAGSAMLFLITYFVKKRKMGSGEERFIFLNEWSRLFFIALSFSGTGLLLLKLIFGRQRPHRAPFYQSDIWNFFDVDWNFQSFPSGHTQVVFCAATMFSLAMPKYRYLFMIIAAMIGITRVGTLYHFPSDVITGAMVGHLLTLWALYFWDRRKIFMKSKRFSNVS